jgi:hypothetical protein
VRVLAVKSSAGRTSSGFGVFTGMTGGHGVGVLKRSTGSGVSHLLLGVVAGNVSFTTAETVCILALKSWLPGWCWWRGVLHVGHGGSALNTWSGSFMLCWGRGMELWSWGMELWSWSMVLWSWRMVLWSWRMVLWSWSMMLGSVGSFVGSLW